MVLVSVIQLVANSRSPIFSFILKSERTVDFFCDKYFDIIESNKSWGVRAQPDNHNQEQTDSELRVFTQYL